MGERHVTDKTQHLTQDRLAIRKTEHTQLTHLRYGQGRHLFFIIPSITIRGIEDVDHYAPCFDKQVSCLMQGVR